MNLNDWSIGVINKWLLYDPVTDQLCKFTLKSVRMCSSFLVFYETVERVQT